MEWIADPQAWVAFVTLLALEIVLGVDNIIFIAILSYDVWLGMRWPAAGGHQAAPRPLRFLRRRVALLKTAPARRGRDFRPGRSTLISPTIRRAVITEEGGGEKAFAKAGCIARLRPSCAVDHRPKYSLFGLNRPSQEVPCGNERGVA